MQKKIKLISKWSSKSKSKKKERRNFVAEPKIVLSCCSRIFWYIFQTSCQIGGWAVSQDWRSKFHKDYWFNQSSPETHHLNRYFLLKAAEIGKIMKLSAMLSLSDLVVVGWQQNSTLRCGKQYGKSFHSMANYWCTNGNRRDIHKKYEHKFILFQSKTHQQGFHRRGSSAKIQ